LGLTNLTRLQLYNNPITDLNLSLELTQKYLTLSTAPIDAKKATETVKKIYAAIGHRSTPSYCLQQSASSYSKLLKQLKIDCIAQHQISPIGDWQFRMGKVVVK
jgi:Leucine-rich repeat (LRR) protein